LRSVLQSTKEAVSKILIKTDSLLQKNKSSQLAPLKWGEEEWKIHVQERPMQQTGMIARALQKLTHVEEWSEGTKQLVYRLFVGMQLSQQAIGMASQIPLKQYADQLQNQVVRAVPEKDQIEIEKDISFLGTLLSDKFEILKENPTIIDQLTRRHPEVRPILKKVLSQPNLERQQIHDILDAYRLQRYVQKSPNASPFALFKSEEWWEIFTAHESVLESNEAIYSEAPLTSWGPRLIKAIGSFLPTSSSAIDQQKLALEKKEIYSLELQNGLKRLAQQKENLPKLEGRFEELRHEVSLLYQELLKTTEKTPKDNCSILALASWAQAVHDKCYAVQQLEEHIAHLMEPLRKALAGDDQNLERYGKKHKNNILQGRVAEVLQIPGVTIPVPRGLASDAIENFLKAEAPDLFVHWQDIGQFFHNYQGTSPFLEQPNVNAHLEAIDQAIAQAFEKAGKDDALFQQLMSPELIAWLDTIKENNDYLMVRSTGAEDTRQTANAGGNVSSHMSLLKKGLFVKPLEKSFAPTSAMPHCKTDSMPISTLLNKN